MCCERDGSCDPRDRSEGRDDPGSDAALDDALLTSGEATKQR